MSEVWIRIASLLASGTATCGWACCGDPAWPAGGAAACPGWGNFCLGCAWPSACGVVTTSSDTGRSTSASWRARAASIATSFPFRDARWFAAAQAIQDESNSYTATLCQLRRRFRKPMAAVANRVVASWPRQRGDGHTHRTEVGAAVSAHKDVKLGDDPRRNPA